MERVLKSNYYLVIIRSFYDRNYYEVDRFITKNPDKYRKIEGTIVEPIKFKN